uniref:Glycosyltransferase n=1 Tax=Linum usitatissimum TaxID=4006 RepID=I2BH81_LINUS|nr:UDP-glycosyltransferase 1 [Linum usitatissimum]
MATTGGESNNQLNVAMFPLFAMGHITPFLHLANQLAARGHRISFLLPTRTIPKVTNLINSHADLVTFHPITVPHVAGLPQGAELIADVPPHLAAHIFAAMDATEDQFTSALRRVNPDIVIFDAAPWVSRAARELGCVPVSYGTSSAVWAAMRIVPSARIVKEMTDEELGRTPPGYPSSAVVPRRDEIAGARLFAREFGSSSLYERIVAVIQGSEAMAMRSCRELEGKYLDYLGEQHGKRVLLTGPVLPKPDGLGLDENLGSWLSKFEPGSVVYCAFGSEVVLHKDQFQELLRGLEQCGRPFLTALKPPHGCKTVEEALPEGFKERVIIKDGRGMVHEGWVQQPQILGHRSVGCFVSHCGFGSMWEALLSDCQILLVPNISEQILCTMFMVKELKVALEVNKDENGWISKEEVCRAVGAVMDEDSELGKEVRRHHLKLREVLGDDHLLDKYVDDFVAQLRTLLPYGDEITRQ